MEDRELELDRGFLQKVEQSVNERTVASHAEYFSEDFSEGIELEREEEIIDKAQDRIDDHGDFAPFTYDLSPDSRTLSTIRDILGDFLDERENGNVDGWYWPACELGLGVGASYEYVNQECEKTVLAISEVEGNIGVSHRPDEILYAALGAYDLQVEETPDLFRKSYESADLYAKKSTLQEFAYFP